ncbi:MAG TPA: family 16 glycoside hydrolase [Chloroflexia bacterium]|nr:family 16 glycoside hydrolase [Chloroflexia bacterium]
MFFWQAATVSHKRMLLLAVAALTVATSTLMPAPSSQRAAANTLFPETGYSIWGPFEQYWNEHGGLVQFGLPRTSVYPAGQGYDAQWFERALFTYDPSKPDPYKVELNLLGTMVTQSQAQEAPFLPARAGSTGQFFDATQHNLSDKFLDYWQSTGGLAIYGYPISEPFMEQSKSDGKLYLVQYFERNRLELHPELAGTQYEVQLGLLGSELLDAQGGPAAIARLGAGIFYPPAMGGVNVPGGGLVGSPNEGTPEPTNGVIPTAPALVPTDKPELFSTDFSSSDLSAWTPNAGYNPAGSNAATWSVEDGVLHQSGDPGDGDIAPDALLLTQRADFTDVALETYIYPTGGEPVGAVLRWSEQGYYAVKMYLAVPTGQPKAELLYVTPTGATILAQAATWPGFTTKQWMFLKFSAQGSHLTVEIDGQRVMEADDSNLTGGSIGLYTYADGTAYFDNLRASGD